MLDLTPSASADRTDGRDRFRTAVAALPSGPLRDVLTAVAYGRDAAARAGTAAAPDDRWRALVAAAERALLDTDPAVLAGVLPHLVAA